MHLLPDKYGTVYIYTYIYKEWLTCTISITLTFDYTHINDMANISPHVCKKMKQKYSSTKGEIYMNCKRL